MIEAYLAQLQANHSRREHEAIPMPVHTHRSSVQAQDGWSQSQHQLGRRGSNKARHHHYQHGGEQWEEEHAVAAKATGRALYAGSGGVYAGSPSGSGLRNRRRSHRLSNESEHAARGESGGVEMSEYSDRRALLGDAERERYGHQDYKVEEDLGRGEGRGYPLPRPGQLQPHNVQGEQRRSSLGLSHESRQRTARLIDLDAAEHEHVSPQDAEIRQVIFNYPAIPSASASASTSAPGSGHATPFDRRSSTPAPAPAPALSRKVSEEHLSALGGLATLRPAGAYAPHVPSQLPVPVGSSVPEFMIDVEQANATHRQGHGNEHADASALHYAQPSTTFSFLSLSGTSSPAVPTSVLGGSWHAEHHRFSPMTSPSEVPVDDYQYQQRFPTMHGTRELVNAEAGAGVGEGNGDLAQSVPDLRRSLPVSAAVGGAARGLGGYQRALSEDGRHRLNDKNNDNDDDYDVLSVPGTAPSVSSYADAETYTPNESRAQSPNPSFPSFPSAPTALAPMINLHRSRSRAEEAEIGAGELGLTCVRSPRIAPLSLAALQMADRAHAHAQAQAQAAHAEAAQAGNGPYGARQTFGQGLGQGQRQRGPMSVVSMSDDSEAGRSDWEAV